MWRILQNIPRGAIRNFGLRPVPKCREDEKEAAQKVQNARQLVCQARLSHNKAILTQILRTSEHQNHGYEDTRNGDNRRRRSFTHDFWSNVGKQCNTAEVVGWGALVIVGIQLGKLYPKRNFGDGDRNPYCPINWVEVAIKLLKDKPSWQAARKVFSTDYSLQYESIIKQHEERKHLQETSKQAGSDERSLSSLPTGLYFDAERSGNQGSSDQNEIKHEPSLHRIDGESGQSPVQTEEKHFDGARSTGRTANLQEAGKEWDDLTKQFTSLVLNEAGMQHAGGGHLTEAFTAWRQASRLGCAKSNYNLAVCYESGRGCEKNMELACKHYEIAAAGGHVEAQFNLAVMYLEGAAGVRKDPQKALKLLELAARGGLKQAQTELGVLYTEEERKDLEKAAGLFEMAADQRDKDGLFYLGICYENGWGVSENLCKAADLYHQAAKEGHSTAQYNLAAFFEHGFGGLPQDQKTAADMYEKAALLGERGAEDEAKRLRKEIHRLALEEHFRIQFDGGTTKLVHSSSSPVLQQPKPSLTQYLQKHLPEFGFADLELKMDSDSGSTGSWSSSDADITYQSDDSSSSSGFRITFQLGDEESEIASQSKFWYDNEDSLTYGQSADYLAIGLPKQRSSSMIELQPRATALIN